MMDILKASFNITSILSFSRFGELLSKQNINKMRCMSAKSVDNSMLFKLEIVKGIASFLKSHSWEEKKGDEMIKSKQ
jgi:hypothetical protein